MSFLGSGRSERTATEQQAFGRQGLERSGGVAGLVSAPAEDAATQAAAIESRRRELEQQALDEIRFTDSGERGQPVA